MTALGSKLDIMKELYSHETVFLNTLRITVIADAGDLETAGKPGSGLSCHPSMLCHPPIGQIAAAAKWSE